MLQVHILLYSTYILIFKGIFHNSAHYVPSPLCLHQAVCSVHEPMTSRPLPWYLVSSPAETVTSPSPSPWSWRPSSSICWPSSGTGRQSSSTTSRASRSDKKLKLSTNLREGSTIAEKAPTRPQFHIYLPCLGIVS